MALSDISLTSGMRNNLISLQKTSSQINTTQTRLSSGKKVNSALDNPTNFFASQAEVQRANDLADRKDSMSEAVQTITAADSGITAITALITSAKGLASTAMSTNDTLSQATYFTQYMSIQSQINTLASDSGYRGTNLLTKGTLSIEFSEKTGNSNLTVKGFDGTAAGLTINNSTTSWALGVTAAKGDLGSLENSLTNLRAQSSTLAGNLTIITTRQDFTTSMVNTLQTGSDNLTLADMNQESANMLMLNTRQSLGTTALSLSSQAAQAVLRLF
jgi:flagellin-like hook-associated protein FlgL